MKKKILLLACFVCSLMGFAQPIDWNKKLPADPNVLIGKLPNGITYYLRHNEEPKDRASFFIIRDAGALLENDDQNGLAHFLEHMAFNGSKNFPENSMISTLERHGISFGGNLNAYTTQQETVYNISDVPMTNEALTDTCLLILHDWSYYLTLAEDEIDKERGVITEEWRTRNSSALRINRQQMPVLFKDSKYAVRDVIGSMDVIRTFKPETIRDFYHKWYRTDLEAIAIAGDFDVKKMEEKIKKVFSSIPAIKNPTPRPFFEIPSHEKTYFCLATDKEATSSRIEILRAFRDKERDGKGYVTYGDIKRSLLQSFFNGMMSNRIGEIIQSGKAPYVTASVGFSGLARGYYCYAITAVAKPNQEKEAVEGAFAEHEKVFQHGFTESELNRIKTNTLVNLESMLKDKDKTHNDSYAEEMQEHFLHNTGITDVEDYVAAVKEILPTITAKEVSDEVKKWWKADNRVILISGPSEGVTHLTEEETLAILAENEGKPIAAYEDNSIDGNLINKEPESGKIVKTKTLPQFDAEEWTLSNGAKVIYRKADFEKEDVTLVAYSPGGTSQYDDLDLLPAAASLGNFVPAYGLGDYDIVAFQKLLTGKQAMCNVKLSSLYENIQGSSIPKDFETMMQMVYLHFVQPRFDSVTHNVQIERNHIQVKQMEGQPRKIMSDSITRITTNYNPRVQLFDDHYVDRITLDRMEKIYRDRFCDASDFTFFIVGNIEKEEAQAMTEKYIGAIPSTYRHEKWIDRKVRGPKGKVEKEIFIPLETPKSTVIITFGKEMKYTVKESLMTTVLGNILNNRYTKSIREEQGGTYGVGVRGAASREPYNAYSMMMQFDCQPEKAAELKPLIYKEVDDIIANGVTEEELSKVVKNTLKEEEQKKAHNNYWLGTLMSYYKTGVNYDDPKNNEDLLKGLTPKDIQKFAKKLFKNADILDLVFSTKK